MKEAYQQYQKSCSVKAASSVEISPDILAKINRYALKPLSVEQVYVRKNLIAHNGVDRDRERFPETLLEDFKNTLPGKSLLKVHDKKSLPIGLYFDAATEDITKERFKELTGEEINLPGAVSVVKILWSWVYLLKEDFNDQIIKNIDAGIYRYVSIGFGASDLITVKGQFDQTLYYEYVSPGEATEGSIVWLGAQQGATAQKAAHKQADTETENNSREGGKDMEKLLAKLAKMFDKNFTEENTVENIKAMIDAKDADIKAMQEKIKTVKALEDRVKQLEPLEQKVKDLEPLAADGKAFRDSLVTDYVALKAKLKEVAETQEAQKVVKDVAEKYPVEFLKQEVKHLQTRVEEKFPSEGQLKGDARRDKSAQGQKDKDEGKSFLEAD